MAKSLTSQMNAYVQTVAPGPDMFESAFTGQEGRLELIGDAQLAFMRTLSPEQQQALIKEGQRTGFSAFADKVMKVVGPLIPLAVGGIGAAPVIAAALGGGAAAGGALEGQALANAMYGGTAAGEVGGFSSALGGSAGALGGTGELAFAAPGAGITGGGVAGGTLEGQALANAMYGGTAAGSPGGFSSALGGTGAAGAGGTAAGLGSSSASVVEPAAGTDWAKMAMKYGPDALKVAGAALPVVQSLSGGGGGGGSGGGSGRENASGGGGSTNPGLMNGSVLGSTGLTGSPQEKEAQSYQLAQTRADWANRPDQTDMYGNKTQWSSHAELDPATGQMVTKWDNKITLDPQQQQAVDSEKAIKAQMMGTAQGLGDRASAAVANPMDYSKFQAWGQTPQGDDQARQRMEAMLMERMAPEYKRQQAGLEAQLGGMGLTRGSDPWKREMQAMMDQQSRGKFDAFQTAGNEMQNQYSRELQSSNYQNQLRGSQIGEETTRRMQPLTEMNAYRQGNQVGAPQFGQFAQSRSAGGVDYSGQYTQQNAERQAGRASTGDAVLNLGTTLGGIYQGYQGGQQPGAVSPYGTGYQPGTNVVAMPPSAYDRAQQQQQPGLMNGGYNAQTGQPRQA